MIVNINSFNNDANTSKHETLCKTGEEGMVHENVMELEINSQNISQEESHQSLQSNACLREHFFRNKSGCNSCKESNKLANEQPCDNPHILHLSEYLPQHTHYENVPTPDFDNDLHDFKNDISFLEKRKNNVFIEPKDIEEIINVLSDDIHVRNTYKFDILYLRIRLIFN